jgi:hypothetical protein
MKPAVLVQIADFERGNLGAPQPDLQADREECAIAQPQDQGRACQRRPVRCGDLRRVEQLTRLRLREGESRALLGVDRRPLDLADRIACRVAVAHQVLEQRRQDREAPTNGCGFFLLDLAHVMLPGDRGASAGGCGSGGPGIIALTVHKDNVKSKPKPCPRSYR